MKTKPYFIKATLKGGVSQGTPHIIYKKGLVKHPNPDRKSKDACGIGIHLAKSLKIAKSFVPKAEEFYFAEPGVILGEDDQKVRCASCRIIKLLTKVDIKRLAKLELTREEQLRQAEQARKDKLAKEAEMINRLGTVVFETGGLSGKDWLMANYSKVTMEDINSQTFEIAVDGKKRCTLKPTLKRKDIRTVLKAVVAV